MTTTAKTSSGTIIAVSASQPATFDQTGYEALSFTDIEEVTNIGEFGNTFNLITHNPVKSRETYKFKGNKNPGALALQMGRSSIDDAGQVILKAARDSDETISFSVTYNDDPGGVGSSPTIQYFQGLVMSYTSNPGDGNVILGSTANVEISGDILEIDKVVGS